MSASAKASVLLAVVGGIIAIVKIILQTQANRELQVAAAEKEARLAQLQREREERLARHQKEAEERAAERAQKDALISQLQKATDETLAVLRSELGVQQKTNDRAFELLDRNTRSTENLAQAVATQAAELRVLSGAVSKLEGGAGCKAVGRA